MHRGGRHGNEGGPEVTNDLISYPKIPSSTVKGNLKIRLEIAYRQPNLATIARIRFRVTNKVLTNYYVKGFQDYVEDWLPLHVYHTNHSCIRTSDGGNVPPAFPSCYTFLPISYTSTEVCCNF